MRRFIMKSRGKSNLMAKLIPNIPMASRANPEAANKQRARDDRARLDVHLPAKVIEYDKATNLATVQPYPPRTLTDGSDFDRAVIKNVPVVFGGSGDWVIQFEIAPGSWGILHACDRDVSGWRSMGEFKAAVDRNHSFSDSVFVPTAPAGDLAGAAVSIGNKAGDVKITLQDGKIKIIATEVEVSATTAKVTATSATIKASTVTVDSPVTNFTGAGNFTGALSAGSFVPPPNAPAGFVMQIGMPISVSGTATMQTVNAQSVTASTITEGAIRLGTHRHSGVASGSATSGGPVA